jgi:hypothetical protein
VNPAAVFEGVTSPAWKSAVPKTASIVIIRVVQPGNKVLAFYEDVMEGFGSPDFESVSGKSQVVANLSGVYCHSEGWRSSWKHTSYD